MIKNFTINNNKLCIGGMTAEELVAQYGSSLYVYDASLIRKRFRELRDAISFPLVSFHYACKQNTNLEIISLLKGEGAKIEVMSKTEIQTAFAAGYTSDEMTYTCSFISREEMAFVIRHNIMMSLDSLTQIKRFGELQPGGKISLRINQGIGAGGHSHMITGGPESKFGIDLAQIDEAKKLAEHYDLTIVGIQQHIGSNILDTQIFIKAMEKLLETAKLFEDLTFIDFGGGFGIPYKPGENALEINSLGKKITALLLAFTKIYGKRLEFKFEPGRYYVGEAGVLLAKVTDKKQTPYYTFVGIDAGMNQLIRPALYGSYHEIVNATHVDGKKEKVSIVGNICESADFFAKDREIGYCSEDDVIAILDAGASGYSMSSFYNGRFMPAEVLVENGKARIIRERNDPLVFN